MEVGEKMDIPSYLLGKKAGGGSGGTTNYSDLSNKPSINNVTLSGNKTTSDLGLFSGDYNDLTNKPTIPTVPTNVSSFTNDAGYLTQHQDISGKQDIIQYSTMPTASVSTVNKIIQYVGTTTNDYTNGYFYIGTTDGGDPATYSWENLQVQEGNVSTNINNFYYLIPSSQNSKCFFTSSAGYLTVNSYDLNDFKNQITNCIQDVYDKGLQNLILCFAAPYSSQESNGILIFQSTNDANYRIQQKPTTLSFKSCQLNPRGNDNGTEIYAEIMNLNLSLSWNEDIVTVTDYSPYVKRTNALLLSSLNTTAFTPTNNYNPATKKYVDDSISSAVGSINTVLATLTTPSGNGGNE